VHSWVIHNSAYYVWCSGPNESLVTRSRNTILMISFHMPCAPSKPSTDAPTLFTRELHAWHQICGTNQARINLFISSQRCFVDSPLQFSLMGRYCHHLLCWQKSQKVWYLFHIHWILMSICSGSITSIQMMCWETCSKISMAPGKQLFVGRAWSMALIQPCRKMSLNGRMIDCMLHWWLRS
jgi:hypothetical protein